MMTDAAPEKYRPPVEERWGATIEHAEPVRIDVRTEWLYSEDTPGHAGDACACCPGRHAFNRGGHVVRSDVPARYSSDDALADHVYRAVKAFGDDADLVIEVRRRDT